MTKEEGSTMQNEGVGPEDHDFIGEVIAEDNEARRLRTISEQLKRVPRLRDDPAVRLAECRGEDFAFDPCKWTDREVLEFLGVALRNVDLVGEVRISEIRQGFEYMHAKHRAGVV